jgi:hypothetical protein
MSSKQMRSLSEMLSTVIQSDYHDQSLKNVEGEILRRGLTNIKCTTICRKHRKITKSLNKPCFLKCQDQNQTFLLK